MASDATATTWSLLRAMQSAAATRSSVIAQSPKAKLQAQLNLVAFTEPCGERNVLQHSSSSTYVQECKESLYSMHLRRVECARQEEPSLLTLDSPRPISSSKSLLAHELTVAKTRRQLRHIQQQQDDYETAKVAKLSNAVVRQSLQRLSSRKDVQDESLRMRGRRQSVHRLRFSVAKVEQLHLPTSPSRPRAPSAADEAIEEENTLYQAVRVAQHARQMRKYELELETHTATPGDAVPKAIMHNYAQVLESQGTLKKISGQAVLSRDEFVQAPRSEPILSHLMMLCLTLGFTDREWALKCYPAACRPHGSSLEHTVTLADFAKICHTLMRGTDLEKMKWVFSIFDRDGGGSVELDEVFQTLQTDKEDFWDQILFSQQLLGIVDRNHDGHMEFQITYGAGMAINVGILYGVHSLASSAIVPYEFALVCAHFASFGVQGSKPAVRSYILIFAVKAAIAPRTDATLPNAIDVHGFTAIISYFFRFARSSAVDQALALRVFHAFDVNNDKLIDFEEFIHGLSTLMQGSPDARARMVHSPRKHALQVLDLDGGGTVTKQEIHNTLVSRKKGLQLHEVKGLELEENVNEIMRALDENGDGSISVEEFQRAVYQTPRILEALQDILFSGCRLDAEFQTNEWKTDYSLAVLPHPDTLLREFRRVFKKAVKKVVSVNSVVAHDKTQIELSWGVAAASPIHFCYEGRGFQPQRT
ncbi:hypothetical protein ACHHYP_12014 [Achlya hypogyna]|uniref:EF-hand domain-containing protein n=1 Tax=Achlya hypogyna TaxID=1202772 RepID=A0A1V9YHT7_ACHHY|nr:hypothetical protein ACHHYP_12014 [Achlya hypogyna]